MSNILRFSLALGTATLAVLMIAELPNLFLFAENVSTMACKMVQMVAGLWG